MDKGQKPSHLTIQERLDPREMVGISPGRWEFLLGSPRPKGGGRGKHQADGLASEGDDRGDRMELSAAISEQTENHEERSQNTPHHPILPQPGADHKAKGPQDRTMLAATFARISDQGPREGGGTQESDPKAPGPHL